MMLQVTASDSQGRAPAFKNGNTVIIQIIRLIVLLNRIDLVIDDSFGLADPTPLPSQTQKCYPLRARARTGYVAEGFAGESRDEG